MATYRVIACLGIPASVEAHDGADSVTRELSDRFQMLIDSVAMQRGLHESDEYLDAWAAGEPQERPGSAREVADAVAEDLESRFAEFVTRAFTTS